MSNPNEPKKNLLLTPWRGLRGLLLWFVLLAAAAFVVVFALGLLVNFSKSTSDWAWASLCIAAGVALLVILFFLFIRWLCCWRNLRRFLIAIACVFTLIALVYAEEDWRGKHDLNQFKREWEAKGEKFDFASFVPPAVPDDQNFALTPIMFTSYGNMLTRDGQFIPPERRDLNFVDRLKMPRSLDGTEEPTNGAGSLAKATLTDLTPWQNYYRDLAAKTNFFPIAPHSQSPSQDVLLALSRYDSTIEELREAARLLYSRFPLDYDQDPPSGILLPHLANLKGIALVLELRSIAELQNGQSDKALSDIKLSLRLAESIRTEPFIIDHLVRVAIVAITLQPIYEGLAQYQWSDAQLAELDAELAKLDFLADYEFSLRGERAMSLKGIEYLRRTRDLKAFQDDAKPYPVSLGLLIPSAFFYQSELTIARMHQRWTLPNVDATNRIVSPETVRQNDEAAMSELNHFSPYNILARMLMPALGNAVKRYTREQSTVDLARVAIALERYRLAHGAYPESLDVLAPQFMDKVPNDIIGGQPLHYRRTGDTFILYSVGWNGTDDGGITVLRKGGAPNWDEGDLVWKYPVK